MIHIHSVVADFPAIVAQMRQLGVTAQITSFQTAFSNKMIEDLGAGAEGIIVTSLAPSPEANANLTPYIERWMTEKGREPNGLPYTQYFYDSAFIIADLYKYVLDHDMAPTGENLRTALLAIGTFDGPLTNTTVIGEDHTVEKTTYFWQVQDGKFVLIGEFRRATDRTGHIQMYSFPILAQLAWTGLAMASVYCLFAVAFALILKVNQVWNFAQAAMMVVAYYALFVAFRMLGLPLAAGLALALVATGVSAWLIEGLGFRTLRRRRSATITYFIFTIVGSQLAAFLAELLFGSEPQTLFPNLISPIRLVGPVAVSDWDIVALATTGALLAALWVFLNLTAPGRRMIAVADNPDLAELFGISVNRTYLTAMIIASVLVVGGMFLIGTKAPIVPSSPLNQFLVFAVIAALVAGIGNVFRAGVAAGAISLIQAFSILVVSSRWQLLIVYALIFVCVLFFPKGVRLPTLTRRNRRAVSSPSKPARQSA